MPLRLVATQLVVLLAWLAPGVARAQNDWQFPDPHFGIAEFGRGRPGPVTERQYREEIGPPGRFSAPGLDRQRGGSVQAHRPRPTRPRPRHRR